jgi:geranylgeranyl diphosphate synthase type I
MNQLLTYKPRIDEFLTNQLLQQQEQLSTINFWGKDSIDKLLPFVTSGKSIRGGLVLFAYESCGGTDTQKALLAAGAIELIHSGLLIHDDIMDQDSLRRGKPSIYTQYETLPNVTNPKHFGTSMGINLGDLCFFLGFNMLAQSAPTLMPMATEEFSKVVMGQMQDVAGGQIQRKLSADEVISIYRYKTARYTFSVPLMVGSTLALADQAIISRLEHLGEAMGLLFQIRDDELNASGDSEISGKSTGSDVANHKQTIQTAVSITQLTKMKADLIERADSMVQNLSFDEIHKAELVSLIAFCHNRDK